MKTVKSAFWLLPQYPNFAFLGRYSYGFKQKTISKLTMVHKVFGNVYSLSIGKSQSYQQEELLRRCEIKKLSAFVIMIGIDQILAEDKDPYKKWGAKFLAGNMWGVATFILGLAATYVSVHQWRPVKKLGLFHQISKLFSAI